MAMPVLAVDDSAPIREMIASLLIPRGYQVVMAEHGSQALETLRRVEEPYIVLLDVVMPGMDGVAVVRAINEDVTLRGVGHRIILMSSPLRLASRDIPMTASQLSKPFTRQQLLEVVEKFGS